MRFEVLKRDAEISCLQGDRRRRDRAFAARRLAAEWQQIDDDFAFVASCNEGGEFMARQRIARLRRSPANLDAHARRPHRHLARRETAQGAAPGARRCRSSKRCWPTSRSTSSRAGAGSDAGRQPLGIPHAVPALLYNRGELYNLAVDAARCRKRSATRSTSTSCRR
jgi:hypothetical protein